MAIQLIEGDLVSVYAYLPLPDLKRLSHDVKLGKTDPEEGFERILQQNVRVRCLGNKDPKACHIRGIWALPKQPTEWLDGRGFCKAREWFEDHSGRVAVQVNLPDDSRRNLVVDMGHLLGINNPNAPKIYRHPTQLKAEIAVADSAVSLQEFNKLREKGGFRLPLVVVLTQDPAEVWALISQTAVQPFMDFDMARQVESDRRYLQAIIHQGTIRNGETVRYTTQGLQAVEKYHNGYLRKVGTEFVGLYKDIVGLAEWVKANEALAPLPV